MPVTRGSARHCEAVEAHGEQLISLLEIVEAVTSDGLVEPGEHHLLRQHMALAYESYRPLPGQASQQDNVFRVIGALAGAGAVTPWTRRLAREAAADEASLEEAA